MVNRVRRARDTPPPAAHPERVELENKRARLVERLIAGDAYINQVDPGDERERLIDGWIKLLHQYEAVCREIWALGD